MGAASGIGGMVLLGLRWMSICWPRELCCLLSLSPLVQRDKDHSLMGPISTREFLWSWDCMSCGYTKAPWHCSQPWSVAISSLYSVFEGWKKIVSIGFRTSARGASQTFFVIYLYVLLFQVYALLRSRISIFMLKTFYFGNSH